MNAPTAPPVLDTTAALREAVAAARAAGRRIALVPTMGALHQGHISLVQAARDAGEFVVVSIFVNPTQFGPGEDFERYPRTLPEDLRKLTGQGADCVYTPSAAEVYPTGYATYVEIGGVAEPLEGAHRPGHFRGVATVVLKLLNACGPDRAYFGQKDYQQTLVIRQMVRDFQVPTEIVVCPIVREEDGLALSSRNVYLDAEARRQALVVPGCLQRAEELIAAGERDPAAVLRQMQEIVSTAPLAQTDYLTLADPDTLLPKTELSGAILAAAAVHIGKTRLIDNRLLLAR